MTNKERDPLGEDISEHARDPLGGLANEDSRDPLGGFAEEHRHDPLDGVADGNCRDPLGGLANEDARDPLGGLADEDTRDPLDDAADEDRRDPLGDVVSNDAHNPLGDCAAPKEDASIGFRKPPRQHTWKPGQSGNARGRRREADEDRNLYDAVNELLDDPIKLNNGQTLSGEDLIAEKIMTDAGNGDPRAFREFIQLCRRAKFFERLAPGPRLPEGMRPTDFLKGEIENLRRKLERFDRRPAKK